jgi:hypothetical protein
MFIALNIVSEENKIPRKEIKTIFLCRKEKETAARALNLLFWKLSALCRSEWDDSRFNAFKNPLHVFWLRIFGIKQITHFETSL